MYSILRRNLGLTRKLETTWRQCNSGLLKGLAEQTSAPPTAVEAAAADRIVESFVNRLAINGILYLYALSLAHTTMTLFSFVDLRIAIGFTTPEAYGQGIIAAASAAGLLTYRKLRRPNDELESDVMNPVMVELIDFNEKLKSHLPGNFEHQIQSLKEQEATDSHIPEEVWKSYAEDKVALIQAYFVQQ